MHVALGPQQGTAAANGGGSNTAVSGAPSNTTAPFAPTAQQASDQSNAAEALRAEKAKAAAAEAQLAAIKKAQAKAARAEGLPAAPTAPTTTKAMTKAEKKAAAAEAALAASSSSSSGVSAAKLAQFNSIVDEGRSMAKQVMHSSNSQNIQLAKNYDQYLKTLKDSMRGVQSDKQADKMIKQASQTRAYLQFLVRQ